MVQAFWRRRHGKDGTAEANLVGVCNSKVWCEFDRCASACNCEESGFEAFETEENSRIFNVNASYVEASLYGRTAEMIRRGYKVTSRKITATFFCLEKQACFAQN